jgi:hypothetical protein
MTYRARSYDLIPTTTNLQCLLTLISQYPEKPLEKYEGDVVASAAVENLASAKSSYAQFGFTRQA